jgi:hypothetical protein
VDECLYKQPDRRIDQRRCGEGLTQGNTTTTTTTAAAAAEKLEQEDSTQLPEQAVFVCNSTE